MTSDVHLSAVGQSTSTLSLVYLPLVYLSHHSISYAAHVAPGRGKSVYDMLHCRFLTFYMSPLRPHALSSSCPRPSMPGRPIEPNRK